MQHNNTLFRSLVDIILQLMEIRDFMSGVRVCIMTANLTETDIHLLTQVSNESCIDTMSEICC